MSLTTVSNCTQVNRFAEVLDAAAVVNDLTTQDTYFLYGGPLAEHEARVAQALANLAAAVERLDS